MKTPDPFVKPLVVDIDQARAAINQAEENMRQAVAAFAEKEKRFQRELNRLFKWATELGYHFVMGLECEYPENVLKQMGVPEDIRAGVLREIKAFREKCQSRSERP